MKLLLRRIRNLYVNIFVFILVTGFKIVNFLLFGRIITSLTLDKIWSQTLKIRVRNKFYFFHTPSLLTYFRAKTMLTKEPETITWIDRFSAGSVFWDVGANVGTFTIYAGKKNLEVIAIEPSYLNLELLTRNVISNNLSQLVTIIPLGVGRSTSLENLYLSNKQLTWGGAHNSMGSNIGFDGEPLQDPISLKSLSFTIDDLVEILGINAPTHLKIDIDGLEAEVLQGSTKSLKYIKSILIEVDSDYLKQKEEIIRILLNNNFKLSEETEPHSGTSNQIWDNVIFF